MNSKWHIIANWRSQLIQLTQTKKSPEKTGPIQKLIEIRESRGEDGQYPDMDSVKVSDGKVEISKRIESFEYEPLLKSILDVSKLNDLYLNCQNGYEKLQIFRMLVMDHIDNSVIQKFINETYHIAAILILESEWSMLVDSRQKIRNKW